MSSNVLAARDVNTSLPAQNQAGAQTGGAVKPDVMSMEYHRQVFQSKMEQGENKTYISPSDNIMSPCTAKLSAFRNKQVGKSVKGKSLFAQASAKKLEAGGSPKGDALFGNKPENNPFGSK
ncbi:uncharacterized protein B0T15DRAFT_491161 [Chaetomium strumarium]|uniref:Spo12-like protein n=1 Tax=Chaetomium strumarium TaxID=1170767 RepID=A0AAJ0GYN1_9PEZI|nr:hypothetical protein B0T15DRAFT_491161 [Chaetomium strumarium]